MPLEGDWCGRNDYLFMWKKSLAFLLHLTCKRSPRNITHAFQLETRLRNVAEEVSALAENLTGEIGEDEFKYAGS